jgi:hypothetical protein
MAAAAFSAEVARAIAEHPAAALVSAELSAVVASRSLRREEAARAERDEAQVVVARREQELLDENQKLKDLGGEELQKENNTKRLETQEQAEADLTYTESGYIPSWEWSIASDPDGNTLEWVQEPDGGLLAAIAASGQQANGPGDQNNIDIQHNKELDKDEKLATGLNGLDTGVKGKTDNGC